MEPDFKRVPLKEQVYSLRVYWQNKKYNTGFYFESISIVAHSTSDAEDKVREKFKDSHEIKYVLRVLLCN